jgi:polysaccharide chain length determinant protein (PEP-CTERM system associated)
MKDFKKYNLSDYVRILWRRRWYALTAMILVLAGASFYAWLKPSVYRSTSRIKVEPVAIPQDYVRPSVRSTPEDQIAAVRSAVQSRSFLQRMIQDFQLFGYGVDVGAFSMEDAIKAVSRNIEITNVSPDTLNIGFSSTDPQLAQSLTRRMVETLIQTNTSSRKTRAIETDQFLDAQLRQAQQDLAAQEEKIKQFKATHLGALPEQSQAVMNALNRLDVQLASAENALENLQERKKMLSALTQNQSRIASLQQELLLPEEDFLPGVAAGDTPDSVLAAKEAELAALTLKYTPKYPDVVRLTREVDALRQKLAKEKADVSEQTKSAAGKDPVERTGLGGAISQLDSLPSTEDLEMQSINNDIRKKEKERDEILKQIRLFQAKLNLAPALEQELMALSRERDILNQQYTSLQGKKFQSQMTANLETNKSGDTYVVIDDANLPEKPLPPTRIQIILVGIFAALAAGVGAAIGRELLDSTLGSEQEVAAVLNLPTLATISEIPLKEPKRRLRLSKSA